MKYYVYEHLLDGEVFYVGKGSGNRYLQMGYARNRYWNNFVGDRINDVEKRIVKYFENEDDAYIYEEELIYKYKKKGLCKCNIAIGRVLIKETKQLTSVNKKLMLEDEEIEFAINTRSEGYSFVDVTNMVNERFNKSYDKGVVYKYVKDIEMTEELKNKIKKRSIEKTKVSIKKRRIIITLTRDEIDMAIDLRFKGFKLNYITKAINERFDKNYKNITISKYINYINDNPIVKENSKAMTIKNNRKIKLEKREKEIEFAIEKRKEGYVAKDIHKMLVDKFNVDYGWQVIYLHIKHIKLDESAQNMLEHNRSLKIKNAIRVEKPKLTNKEIEFANNKKREGYNAKEITDMINNKFKKNYNASSIYEVNKGIRVKRELTSEEIEFANNKKREGYNAEQITNMINKKFKKNYKTQDISKVNKGIRKS